MHSLRGLKSAVFLALGLSSAQAATLIPVVPVPGSTATLVIGINDNNVITGSYEMADGSEHGFFGTLDGSYTTFDFDEINFPGTQARGINNKGLVTGFANTVQGDLGQFWQFERFVDGSMKRVTDHSVPQAGVINGINTKGVFAGENYNSNDRSATGYLGKKAKVLSKVDLGFAANSVRPRGVNDSGDVVGYFTNATSSGFLIHNGVVSQIDYPDPNRRDTLLEGENNRGVIAGYWKDLSGVQYAFYIDTKTNSFVPIAVPGFTDAEALGINSAGLITLQAFSDSSFASYVYCPKPKRKCPAGGIDVPDGSPRPAVLGAAVKIGTEEGHRTNR